MIDNTSYINKLPVEVLKVVYDSLGLEGKMLIMPKVSLIWHSFYELLVKEQNEICFNKIRLKNANFSESQINKITDLANGHRIITELKSLDRYHNSWGNYINNDPFQVKYVNEVCKFYPAFQNVLTVDYSDSIVFNWDSNELKPTLEKGKWGNFQNSCKIIFKIYKYECFLNIFKLHVEFNSINYSTIGLFGIEWNISKKNIVPLGMGSVFNYSLKIDFKIYINFFTTLNLEFVKSNKINLLNPNSKKTFDCDRNGRFINFPESQYKLDIINQIINNECSILTWESIDFDKFLKFKEKHSSSTYEESYRCKFNKLLRWTIFSSTVKELNSLLGYKLTKL